MKTVQQNFNDKKKELKIERRRRQVIFSSVLAFLAWPMVIAYLVAQI